MLTAKGGHVEEMSRILARYRSAVSRPASVVGDFARGKLFVQFRMIVEFSLGLFGDPLKYFSKMS